ncbi:MAG: phosphoribosylformylglycinamidine cyclo-ligase [Methanospirillum sp.]|nr:phosphoribosylformylglycinamidine cyclo-ligase [Methanospirillum sp.]
MTNERAYRDAGVDIRLEADGVAALVRELTYRRQGPHAPIGGTGHFAGLIEFGPMVLALATDGVGTKMLVADAVGDWSTVGIDCIAMNANDLYVMNIEPIAFVDYIACDRVDPAKMAEIGRGLNEGARLANLSIVGGETATLAGLVNGLDLAGTVLGVQRRERVITGEKCRPGDLVVGLPSSGVHSNGLSLARRIAGGHGGYDQPFGGHTLGRELLTPTRIYGEVPAITARHEVHGMCHVTGGGLLNLVRLTRFGFSIDAPIAPPPIFDWLQERGDVSREEMYRTFNMGMGFALVVPEDGADGLVREVPGSKVVGAVTEEPGVRLSGRPLE